jgi:uncharacterized protein YceK
MKPLFFGFCVCALGLQGCASIIFTTPLNEVVCENISGSGACDSESNKIYIGTRVDAGAIRHAQGGAVLFPLLDLPFSAAMDTVFLPYTVTSDLVESH